MKLVTYSWKKNPDRDCLGIVPDLEEGILPLNEAGLSFRDMNELIEQITPDERQQLEAAFKECAGRLAQGGETAKKERERLIPFSDIIRRSPIPRPRQDVICLGINYAAHAEESARYNKRAFETDRRYSVYFSKRVNEAVPDMGEIPCHSDLTERLDYESELAVIIGKDARNVKAEDAYDYIFGYTILNDISAREVQNLHKQWYFGKSLDGFTPMGPWIVTADEIPAPPVLKVRSYVNGELRQNGSTDLLLASIGDIIEDLSSGMTLKAGSIISTGTPAGVGMGFDPPKFLSPGDVVICEIEKIGRLTNVII